MNITGHLQKMRTEATTPVQYTLVLDNQAVPLNDAIGFRLDIRFTGNIHCIECGRKTKKSFNQGYCYPCMTKLAQCDSCIVSPEKCHFHLGTCREPEWAKAHCMQPHKVYLANSTGIKVGITRGTQIPTRWMDQGATAAVPVLTVKNRYLSGLVEVLFKQHVTDRTQWQRMLKGPAEEADLSGTAASLLETLSAEIDALRAEFGEDAIEVLDESVQSFDYPVARYPTKVKAFNLDRQPEISGILDGIKGQYLIFDNGVVNIRKYGGYEVVLSCEGI